MAATQDSNKWHAEFKYACNIACISYANFIVWYNSTPNFITISHMQGIKFSCSSYFVFGAWVSTAAFSLSVD